MRLASVTAFTVAAYALVGRPWQLRWGASDQEVTARLSGDDLVSCQVHSADRMVPHWRDVTVGDPVHLAPEVARTVAAVAPPRALVLTGGVPMGDAAPHGASR